MVASLQVKIIDSKAVDHVFYRSNSDGYNPGKFYLPIPKNPMNL